MKPDEPRWDDAREEDEQISALLRATNHDMPPPDPQFLERLRETTTQAYLNAGAGEQPTTEKEQTMPPTILEATGELAALGGPDIDRRLAPPQSGRVRRLFAACAAMAAVAAGIYWLATPPSPAVALTLAEALDRTARSETLQLTIHRDGERHDVWMAGPARVRVDNPDGTYEITRENTHWRIDERENRASGERLPASDAADARPRDVLLGLLGTTVDSATITALERAQLETLHRDGREWRLYRADVPGGAGKMTFEAVVDAQTNVLESLAIHVDRDGVPQPVVELNVVAINQPIADEKFVVRDTLTEDGRVGKVTDVQGLAAIRPVMHQRWTPVCQSLPLKPGDWLRTDVRGANAVAVRLSGQAALMVGPGSLLEVLTPTKVRLHTGELEATVPEQETLDLLGPGKQRIAAAAGRGLYRVRQEKLAPFDRDPPWLGYFKGTTSNESLGSLVALVDGRNVPLTVGYHKVTVDIRDQIARTVVEESFVNRTDLVLEGVFHFPLPADASISGFGMWIGNELVEADVVEKQRAREIYETILREKRDPGLLEWEGGNVFKARVYPIPAHSEKRVRISYTQVLPARGGAYRYSYALQSDLLKLHPLRDLSLDVKIASAVPLKNVSSPTHTVRIDSTGQAAHLEFAAQEYVPTRDFEVVVETAGRQSEVVLIPHRRGDDGYFMLQLTPPSSGAWQRETVPDGEPIDLLILADTSTSMESRQRQAQAELVAALLGALAPRDSVNLAGCDIECDWVFESSRPAEAANITALREFLQKRHSLGWTDLDKAFASAFARCGPRTHLIYIGDGIVTTGDASPEDFARRLKRLHAGVPGSCHAVAVGSSFEAVVMQSIAGLGGGSVRRVTGEQGPAAIALELLREIAEPGLRDLKVEFRGLKTARVYPEQLPNLPAGSQQILLGRYLPGGGERSGQVTVTGIQSGQPVTFTAGVSLKDAEQGNSFIPRLWARQHLDSLLSQGSAGAIKDEIIALSEGFQIMTPYTSFLVLETDSDRERFGVKRRFRIRDGEKYFQEGRDNVNYELVQQQMRRASNWRLELRRSVLRQLALLGRTAQAVQAWDGRYKRGGMTDNFFLPLSSSEPGIAGNYSNGFSLPGSAPIDSRGVDYLSPFGSLRKQDASRESLGLEWDGPVDKSESQLWSLQAGIDAERTKDHLGDFDEKSLGNRLLSKEFELTPGEPEFFESKLRAEWGTRKPNRGAMSFDSAFDYDIGPMSGPSGGAAATLSVAISAAPYGRGWSAGYDDPMQFLQGLFPSLPAAASGRPAREPKSNWPDEALALSRSLLRTESLRALEGGVEIGRSSRSFDARWDEMTHQSETLALYSPSTWLTRAGSDWSQTIVNWCDGGQRGVFGQALQLGRTRKAAASDLNPSVLESGDYSLGPLHETYRQFKPSIVPQADQRALLVLTAEPKQETRVLIDKSRHVILSIETRYDGKTQSAVTFDDFVEAGGSWWAGRIESTDGQGRRTSLVTQSVVHLAAEPFQVRIEQELAPREAVQLVAQPLLTPANARRSLARAGGSSYDVELSLLLDFARSQQWSRVFEHLDRSEKLAAGKPGVRWVRNALLQISRRHVALVPRLREESAALPVAAGHDNQFLLNHLVQQAASILESHDMLGFVEGLQAVFAAQPPHTRAMQRWGQHHAGYLDATGQPEAALAERRQLALDNPHDADEQMRYAQALYSASEREGAYGWIERALGPDARWRDDEEQRLRNTVTQFLQQEGRYAELAEYLARWTARDPEGSSIAQQYLSSLYQTDQIEEADRLIAQWLAAGREGHDQPLPVAARLTAAIQLALGQGYWTNIDHIEEKWHGPLAETALHYALAGNNFHPADLILGHWRFQATEAARQARRTIGQRLLEEAATLPLDRLQRFIGWTISDGIDEAGWRKIAAALEERWAGEKETELRDRLAQSLVQVLSVKLGVGPHLDFLRRQLREGAAERRTAYANELFRALLAQAWPVEPERAMALEAELFALLEQLSDAELPDERLYVQIGALQQVTDWMVNGRNTVGLGKIREFEKLNRTEQAATRIEQMRLAREGAAERLSGEAAGRSGPIVSWIQIERLLLLAQTGKGQSQVFEDGWELLASADAKKQAPSTAVAGQQAEADDGDSIGIVLDRLLQQRGVALLAFLATRKEADRGQIDRTLQYVDRQIAAVGVDSPEAADLADLWKSWKFRLLVALDRPVDLQGALKSWIQEGDPLNRWRLALGYLLAEQGAVPEAIGLFEGVETADALDPQAWRALAGWYLAANRREAYEQAQRQVYLTLDEWRMNQWLQQQLSPWQRTDQPLPSELDPQVLLMFEALFEKSGSPENYVWVLQQFYRATRDFRLLAVVADSVTGRTALRSYPFLQGLRSVLGEIRDEATADELVRHIGQRRGQAGVADDQRTVDLRALDLLEVLVERRAAEVQNQPGPHVDRALAALGRAFARAWTPGEQRLMADFLANLGGITQPALAAEQLREMEVLHAGQAPGSFDRLHVGMRRAELISYQGRPDRAIDLLEAALDEFRQSHAGRLPALANEALAKYLSFLESARHFARAEGVVAGELKNPTSVQQQLWLTQKLYEVYHEALRHDGTASIGTGAKLFVAFNALLRADLATGDQNHRYQVLSLMCSVYRTAHDKKIAEARSALRDFARQVVQDVLKRQTSNYQSIVNQVAFAVHDVLGPKEGLAFLLDSFDHEPRWLRYQNYDGWNQHGYTLAMWRAEVKDLGDLEPRLLKVVLAELRRDLETQQARNRSLYHAGYGHFWKEQRGAFAETAEDVLKTRGGSGGSVLYIADYLWNGLQREDRAIEALFVAHRQRVLDENGQYRLIDWLHQKKRYGESIALLEPLVEERPELLQYRLWLMQAFFHTQRPAELRATLRQADGWFRKKDQWTEAVLAGLAATCLDTQLYEESIRYYGELIPRHQQSQPQRGIGNGTLSGYYANLAMAHAGLGQTAQAVDAAGSAIVSWGADVRNRGAALATLRSVLARSPDLPGYVAQLDKETSAGDDLPIVRKSLGQVLLDQGKAEAAIIQLRRALVFSPADVEIHQALLKAFDAQKDKPGAIEQLLQTIDVTRRDLALYQDLARRFAELELPLEAERAWTAMIDAMPSESESHAALAEARQQQNRWDEAIEQWQQVARIRALEPTGLQKLAAAQLHQQQWDAAEQTIRKLETTPWPGRFEDAYNQARAMRQQLEMGRK